MASGAKIEQKKKILLEYMKGKDASEINCSMINEMMFIREYERVLDDVKFLIRLAPLSMDKEKCRRHFHRVLEYLQNIRYKKGETEKLLADGDKQQLCSLILKSTTDYQIYLKNFCNTVILAWVNENNDQE